ncbi:MAG: hypothetical protein IPH93_15110 [Saprospiraceae bacterium]|nr:hypothetical protein [Saprospiraceae bacterium]
MQNAFLFILYGVLGRMLQVPMAEYFLQEHIKNRKLYYFGILISAIGTLYYQIYSKTYDYGISFSTWDLATAIIYLMGSSRIPYCLSMALYLTTLVMIVIYL